MEDEPRATTKYVFCYLTSAGDERLITARAKKIEQNALKMGLGLLNAVRQDVTGEAATKQAEDELAGISTINPSVARSLAEQDVEITIVCRVAALIAMLARHSSPRWGRWRAASLREAAPVGR